MKVKKLKPPKADPQQQWRAHVQAYCHQVWGRGGFEALTEKAWTRFWDSEARPKLTEWEFAVWVVLPYCAHHAVHKGTEAFRKAATFATMKSVKAEQRSALQSEENIKKIFGTAQHVARLTGVTPKPEVVPPAEPEDPGRFEQPPRDPGRLKKMFAKSGPPPYPVTDIRWPALVRWVELVTDWCADQGEFPTVHCLVQWVHHADGPDDRDEAVLAARRIAALYEQELERELEQNRRLYDRSMAPEPKKEDKPKKEPKPEKPKPKQEARSQIVTVVGDGDSKKYTVFGHPVTAVLRWMGKDAWTFDEARLAMTRLGIPEVKDNTLKAQLMTGRKGDGVYGRKPAAVLTKDQEETLYALLEDDRDVEAKSPKPARGPAERPAAEGRQGEKGRQGKAQVPATQHKQAQGPAVPHGKLPARVRATKDAGAKPRPAEGRAARVHPADEPARLRGRAGSADPGKAGGKGGVGHHAAGGKAEQRPGGRGRDRDVRPPTGRGKATGRSTDRRPAERVRDLTGRKAPGKPGKAPYRPQKPPLNGKPRPKPGKPANRR